MCHVQLYFSIGLQLKKKSLKLFTSTCNAIFLHLIANFSQRKSYGRYFCSTVSYSNIDHGFVLEGSDFFGVSGVIQDHTGVIIASFTK